MRFRLYGMTLLIFLCLMPFAIMQSGAEESADEPYPPRLADIMSETQLRHMKLWFAGGSSNWTLAAYELRKFKASLIEAASLYPGIPASNFTTMANPVQAVANAVEAKDSRAFASAFGSLTAGCNTCHQSMGRGYIVMRVPTASPFSDQVFLPQGKP